jgi:acetoacetyl-CoA reductase
VVAGCGPTRDYTKWLDEQKAKGYTFYASVGNVGDWDSTVAAFDKVKAEHGPSTCWSTTPASRATACSAR